MPPLSLEEAQTEILCAARSLETEILPLEMAEGRILATDVWAKTALPPFAQSAMDGYAIRAEDTIQGSGVELQVIGSVAAGHLPQEALRPGTALRIMTGAPLPAGCTAVVKREDTVEAGDRVRITRVLSPGENIIPVGIDIQAGEQLFRKGEMITPSILGLLASLGEAVVPVFRKPRIAILALGDELVEVHEPLSPGKIRVSNLYTIAAQVNRYGGIPLHLGIARDNLADMYQKFVAGQSADLFLTLGGSQRGDYDLVDDFLLAQGGKIIFREVALNYCRSLIFGELWEKPLLGLPGSPIASRVSFEVFVRPLLWKLAGRQSLQKSRISTLLLDRITAPPHRRIVVPLKVFFQEDEWKAIPLFRERAPSSPSLLQANGLVYLAPGQEILPEQKVHVELWESPD